MSDMSACPAVRAVLAPLLLVLALTACSTPATRVTLLPQDGQRSSVVVRSPGGETVLSQPYQRAVAPRDATTAPRLEQADPAALRQAMIGLWNDEARAAQMGRMAEVRYWQLFTAERMVKSYVEQYAELAGASVSAARLQREAGGHGI